MISVITPTHNVQYLEEAYQSLVRQTYRDWEWVLVPNNGAVIPDEIAKDPRVKIYQYSGSNKIGEIKNFAFMQGTGDWLVELDHDDLLASNCLEEISKQEVDFVYSNGSEFFENGLFHFYPNWQQNGWRYRTATVDGRDVSELVSFKPSAGSCSVIYYAPNHVRAWKKEFYRKIGGHNKDYAVCDDHELVVRTYLHGTMKHIDKCLYLYRMGSQNTFSKRLDEIRNLTYALYSSNIEHMIRRESVLTGSPIYDLGGAFNSPEGWTPVDIEPMDDKTVKANLDETWPFQDDTVLAFRAHDIIEHLKDKQHVMEEAWRCLKPGGWLLINVPSTDGRGAFQDPTHISFYNENSFWYYTRPETAKYIRNDKYHFIERRLFTYFPTAWHKENNISYVVAELQAIKGDMSEVPGYRRF